MASSKHPKSSNAHERDAAEHDTPPTHQVWLAGLGAMAKAQEQGSKAIEALLADGLAFQRKSQAEAQQRLQEATERLSHMAAGLGQSASVRVDKLEHLFEDRVAKALHRLGMPSLVDIQMLSERVAQLESQLRAVQKGQVSAHAPRGDQPVSKAATPKAATARAAAKSAKPQSARPQTAAAQASARKAAPPSTSSRKKLA